METVEGATECPLHRFALMSALPGFQAPYWKLNRRDLSLAAADWRHQADQGCLDDVVVELFLQHLPLVFGGILTAWQH